MSITHKTWTALGLGTVTAFGLIGASCTASDETSAPAADEWVSSAPNGGVSVNVGEGGEGGEGEGGVAIDNAATDPVVFLSALAITEAHILAARDAHQAGETSAAAEMFAHPVAEVLADMEAVFEQRGVSDFTDLLLNASSAVYDGETPEQISVRTDDIIAALRKAGKHAPDDGRSAAHVQAGVISDQVNRAADMYPLAIASDQYEPYLDGYGFYAAAAGLYSEHKTAIKSENSRAGAEIEAALSVLQEAYPSALRPDTLDINPAKLQADASKVALTLN